MIHLFLISVVLSNELYTKYFVFNDNYAEIWYLIPAEKVYSLHSISDSLYEYKYHIVINSENGDRIIREGIKGIRIESAKIGSFVLDCFPIFLYPAKFYYKINISLFGEMYSGSGEFEVTSDTVLFYLSDIVLGSKTRCDTLFSRKSIKFTPKILPEYSNLDTLFSYLEIYGLVPDSLFYLVHYQIKDSLNQIVYECELMRLKYEYSQFDTISISLWHYHEGSFKLIVEIFDPALNIKSRKESIFHIKEVLPEIVNALFAWEIKYLVSDQEYKNFRKKTRAEQIKYLKKFRSKRNYKEFEKRLLEADARFSTSFIKGRDTPMGRYYINNGPPDEIHVYGPDIATSVDVRYKGAHIDEPQEVWIYESKGIQVIFKDKNKDGI